MSLVKQRIIERQSKRRSVTYPEEAQTKNSIFKAFTFQGGTRTPADRATLICVCKAAFTKTERESNMCHKTKKTHSNTSSLNHTRLQRSTIKNAVKGGKEINLSGNARSLYYKTGKRDDGKQSSAALSRKSVYDSHKG